MVSFVKLGQKIIDDGYGSNTDNAADLLKNLPDSRLTVCLLATVAQQLSGVVQRLDMVTRELRVLQTAVALTEKLRDGAHIAEVCAISDGAMATLRRTVACGQIPDGMPGLDPNCRRILERNGIKYMAQLTEETLMSLVGCGPVKCRVILKWAATLTDSAQSSEESHSGSTESVP